MRIVSPIATTEPNATSSTMIATPMPMSSLLGADCTTWASAPVNSVCTPAARAATAAAVASSNCVTLSLVTVYETSTYAVFPLALIAADCAPKGSVTPATS